MKPCGRAVLSLICWLLVLAGCQPSAVKTYPMVSQPLTIQEEAVPDLTLTAYQATDVLFGHLNGHYNVAWPVISTSFVDTENLNQTSGLGRLLSRQVASRMSQIGFSMVESKLRNTMSINTAGEFILSRDIKLLETEHRARGVLVGSYTVADRHVYVTIQMIGLKDQVVLATADFTLPVTSSVRVLLGVPRGVPMQDALTRGRAGGGVSE